MTSTESALHVSLSDHDTLYWLIYEVMLLLFFIAFLFIFHRGRYEYRPYTHQRFERLRIASLISITFSMIWALQFILPHTKIPSLIFGALSDALLALIITLVTSALIGNYFALKTQLTPSLITKSLYLWCCITALTILAQLLSFLLAHNPFIDTVYTYTLYVDAANNITFFLLLLSFIVLFTLWLLAQHHRIRLFQSDANNMSQAMATPSDITFNAFGGVTCKMYMLCAHV